MFPGTLGSLGKYRRSNLHFFSFKEHFLFHFRATFGQTAFAFSIAQRRQTRIPWFWLVTEIKFSRRQLMFLPKNAYKLALFTLLFTYSCPQTTRSGTKTTSNNGNENAFYSGSLHACSVQVKCTPTCVQLETHGKIFHKICKKYPRVV